MEKRERRLGELKRKLEAEELSKATGRPHILEKSRNMSQGRSMLNMLKSDKERKQRHAQRLAEEAKKALEKELTFKPNLSAHSKAVRLCVCVCVCVCMCVGRGAVFLYLWEKRRLV